MVAAPTIVKTEEGDEHQFDLLLNDYLEACDVTKFLGEVKL